MRDFTECGTHIKKSLPQLTDAIVRAEQVRLLYGSRAILLINLVNAPIAAVLLWRIYPAWIMLGWASLFFIVIAARILLWRRFQRHQPAIQAAEHWGPGFALGAIVTGCLWGLLGSVVFMTQNLAYYVFVVFLLGGMTAGAAMRESAYLPAFYGFATPAVLPMIVALLTKGGYTMGAMGLLLTSFAVMLLLMGRENNRWITGSIRLRIEQATLNDDLQRMASDLERDVSERTQAEIALQEREAELREAQRVAHVGDWGWLPEANKTEWSEELYRIFGRDPGLPAPSVQEHAHFMTSESFARMKTAIAACRDTGAPYEIDLELVRPDGAAAWISARGEAQRDADGRITRIRGTAQDITARTHAEQNIAKLHEKMAEHVNALRRHEQDMTAIAKLSDILQSCHSTAEAYPIIVTTASNLFRETNGALALTAGGTHELETVAQWGANQTMLPEFSFDDCWALRTGQRHEVSGPGSGTECRHFKSAPRGSYVCLPLTVHGETSGLLHLNVAADRVVDEDLRWQMLAFGDVVKLSLSNLELRETLSKQAMRDQLTTLFNRHYLAETLPREIYRAQRNHMTLCLSMLDIDHFKVFNDAYGHDAGDVILRELGALLGGSLRASDIACRYGGEEFLLVLPDCDLNGARARLRQIRLEIKRKTIVFHGQALPSVTMSVGLAQLGGDLASADALITAADEALYAAKRNGRDRIEIFRSQIRQTAPMLPSAQPALPHAVVK